MPTTAPRRIAINITDMKITPIEAFAKQVEEHPDQVYLRQPIKGKYHEKTWSEAYDNSLRLAQGLLNNGLSRGDRVAILAGNSAEWFISDFALVAAGLIPTPIYATAGEEIIRYVVEHSEAKAIIIGGVGKPDMALASVPKGVMTISMSNGPAGTDHTLAQLIQDNQPLADIYKPSLEDTWSIVYTSGSTGKPKGVVLTYQNVSYTATISVSMFDKGVAERYLSYLPLAHVTERALVQYNSLYSGGTVSFNESLETFIQDLRGAGVTSFISVPRLWVKFQSQVLANVPQKKLNLLLKLPILGNIVKKKIRTQLGLDNCLSFGSGSAPISPSILKWYNRLDMPIAEGWGMSETIGLATTNFPFRLDKLGTIGKAVDGFEVKASEQGEILIRGAGVFKEYYKNPETTAEAFTEDGFLRTGDKAEIDSEGYLTITGRVKDLFKSGKGKYVAPVPIEAKLADNQLIEQLCVMGSGLPTAMAVVVLSDEVAKGMSKQEIAESLAETLKDVNSRIEKHEVVGGIRIVKDQWTIENGLLTPTLKVKRAELEAKYMDFCAQPHTETIVWE
ncbi:AMP-binding protein [Arenicella xantha]|uniref:Long-subunit acyl-CoA synthetase (AMP-forming) n=1 Tax=Arenicella xantha TaxID=644221 RepID=A0A395JL81_9GAMM|nr:AMP-binding protein [Arenicella xantha]RBP49792.1 long-subunit acyl-CoA synthetase (AMP-forming) [Arenicella xantha]